MKRINFVLENKVVTVEDVTLFFDKIECEKNKSSLTNETYLTITLYKNNSIMSYFFINQDDEIINTVLAKNIIDSKNNCFENIFDFYKFLKENYKNLVI